ncbi:MAG TPA: hypothetical protein PK867_14615, partial [Pirellulales bacterium]|nr:hypothetical protein [Pirellulales bacterium]
TVDSSQKGGKRAWSASSRFELGGFRRELRIFAETRPFFAQRQLRAFAGARVFVLEQIKVEWLSISGAARAIGPDEGYSIVKGRKLLRGCV